LTIVLKQVSNQLISLTSREARSSAHGSMPFMCFLFPIN
jgi:hypothetical protein